MSSESEHLAQVTNLSERLTKLLADYETAREGGVGNQQFLAAGGYLHRAEIHLTNAANDFRRREDVAPTPPEVRRGRGSRSGGGAVRDGAPAVDEGQEGT